MNKPPKGMKANENIVAFPTPLERARRRAEKFEAELRANESVSEELGATIFLAKKDLQVLKNELESAKNRKASPLSFITSRTVQDVEKDIVTIQKELSELEDQKKQLEGVHSQFLKALEEVRALESSSKDESLEDGSMK